MPKSVTIPWGGTAVVTIERPRPQPAPISPVDTVSGDAVLTARFRDGFARATLTDLDVVYEERPEPTGDPGITWLTSGFFQRSMERSLITNEITRRAEADFMVEGLGDVEVAYSGRKIPRAWAFQVGAETDGTLSNLTYTSVLDDARETRVDLLGETSEWAEQVDYESRITELFALWELAEGPEKAAYKDALDEMMRTRNEAWRVRLGRINRQGTALAYLAPGRYHASFSSVYHYKKFDPTFHYTTEPDYDADPIPAPVFGCGQGQSISLELGLVPREHRLYFSYYAGYFVVTLWAQLEIFLPQQRFWRDRLPWEPPFSLTGSSAERDSAMSGYIQTTQTYQSAIAEDLAIQRFSALFAFILTERVAGRWIIFEGSEFPRELAGVITDGVTGRVVYAWRNAEHNAGANELAGGILSTPDVSGDDSSIRFINTVPRIPLPVG